MQNKINKHMVIDLLQSEEKKTLEFRVFGLCQHISLSEILVVFNVNFNHSGTLSRSPVSGDCKDRTGLL